jgi:hypothetical protein
MKIDLDLSIEIMKFQVTNGGGDGGLGVVVPCFH